MNSYFISEAEAGQKLLRFLERRFEKPRPLLYRLLRGGQIRVNGKRCKQDYVLAAGDTVKVPPSFFADLGISNTAQGSEQTAGSGLPCPSAACSGSVQVCNVEQSAIGADLKIVFQNHNLLVLNKPYGLAVHGGTRITDNVASRLSSACKQGSFVPKPAHRLDKTTSGLLLVCKTHAMLTSLHELMREAKVELERDYLCWVKGDFSIECKKHSGKNALKNTTVAASNNINNTGNGAGAAKYEFLPENTVYLEHCLVTEQKTKGQDKIKAYAVGSSNVAKGHAVSKAYYSFIKKQLHPQLGLCSLVRARLLTGSKHQIRVQLATIRYPVIGDSRYGGGKYKSILLHAAHVRIPKSCNNSANLEFTCLPEWNDGFEVDSI
ncbi:RluA family pseudouridine synthase [Desulfovibrio sp. OttesenSCG-928-F07]|nr:RluA family pseudouridine synthase [Desulfovibrio sp. OttesenSCG-928-F07]